MRGLPGSRSEPLPLLRVVHAHSRPLWTARAQKHIANEPRDASWRRDASCALSPFVYQGVQLVKRLAQLSDKSKQRAEASTSMAPLRDLIRS